MNLVVFDIDGTLLKYHPQRNDRAYVRAVHDIFDLTIQNNWTGFIESTDSGILNELSQKKFGRRASQEEIKKFKINMEDWLEKEYGKIPFEPQGGSKLLWHNLSNHMSWKLGVGTGNWSFSAHFKLTSAGFKMVTTPMGSADDAETREEILKSCLHKAQTYYHISEFQKIVYVGDWIWDVRAAKALGWKFIGIAKEPEAQILREEGAEVILPDFNELLSHLEKI